MLELCYITLLELNYITSQECDYSYITGMPLHYVLELITLPEFLNSIILPELHYITIIMLHYQEYSTLT